MRIVVFVILALAAQLDVSPAYAAKKILPKVSVNFTGKGSANFTAISTEAAGGICNGETFTATEDASSVSWNVSWKSLTPAFTGNAKSTSASFSAPNSRTVSQPCENSSSSCNSTLTNFLGIGPRITIAKSGKGYLLTVIGEEELQGDQADSGACLQSAIFNNSITADMNGINITAVKVKIMPATKNKTISLPYTNHKTFDCLDPASQETACAITTNLTGVVKITGKWTAKLVK